LRIDAVSCGQALRRIGCLARLPPNTFLFEAIQRQGLANDSILPLAIGSGIHQNNPKRLTRPIRALHWPSGDQEKPMPTIFVSYRRSDSQDVTGRIYDRLVSKFTPKHVFKDVDNIPLGVSFAMHIQQMIGKANVTLVIIGPNWLTATDEQGRRRLDDPGDFVRIEVESALRAGMPVVPVLVSNAVMPKASELPKSIQALVARNGMPVRPDPDFNNECKPILSRTRWSDWLPTWVAQPFHGAMQQPNNCETSAWPRCLPSSLLSRGRTTLNFIGVLKACGKRSLRNRHPPICCAICASCKCWR
jgi:hypothetical protein